MRDNRDGPLREVTIGTNQELSEYDAAELKGDINNFLWARVPGKTTIDELDDIAASFYTAIYDLHKGTSNA